MLIADFQVGDRIKDIKTGLLGEVIGIEENGDDAYPIHVSVPDNAKRISMDGYPCPADYWVNYRDLIHAE